MYMNSNGVQPTSMESIGNRVGILVLHGFSCTTQTVLPWAEAFAKNGYTVNMPVLAGHHTTPEQLYDVSKEDLVQSTLDAYQWLEERTDHIVVCGFDFGGTLAQYLAENYHIDGLLLLNSPFDLPTKLTELLATHISNEDSYVPIGTADIKNPRATVARYDKYPVHLAQQLIAFAKEVAEDAAKIEAPMLVMHSIDDHVIPPQSVDHLISTARSKEKHLVMLKDSYHYALVDYDAPRIVEQSLYFVKGIDPDRYALPTEEKSKRKKRRFS